MTNDSRGERFSLPLLSYQLVHGSAGGLLVQLTWADVGVSLAVAQAVFATIWTLFLFWCCIVLGAGIQPSLAVRSDAERRLGHLSGLGTALLMLPLGWFVEPGGPPAFLLTVFVPSVVSVGLQLAARASGWLDAGRLEPCAFGGHVEHATVGEGRCPGCRTLVVADPASPAT